MLRGEEAVKSRGWGLRMGVLGQSWKSQAAGSEGCGWSLSRSGAPSALWPLSAGLQAALPHGPTRGGTGAGGPRSGRATVAPACGWVWVSPRGPQWPQLRNK